jgi:DNA-binding MarR family transcriptional regulator
VRTSIEAVIPTPQPQRAEQSDQIRRVYLETLMLVERLHRQLLDVIKDELERRGRPDINSVQALLLYNIGDRQLTAGDLRTRGCYEGVNVSHNVKKLIGLGLIEHRRSPHDRRTVRIQLTAKGGEVSSIVKQLYERHTQVIEEVTGIGREQFSVANTTLTRLDRFWRHQILYRL